MVAGWRVAGLSRHGRGHRQLAILRNGQARVVTHAANDVVDFAWRPDGAAIAYAAYDPASRADFFEPGAGDYTQTAPTPAEHLWLLSLAGDSVRRLTHGSWTIAPTDPGGIFTSQFAWSSNGRRIYYTKVATTWSGADEFSTIESLDVATERVRDVTGRDRFELAPQPMGARLAYWYPENGQYLAQNQLHVISNGHDRVVSRALDRNVGGTQWMPGGKAFLACGDDGAHGAAWSIGVDGSIERLTLGGLTMVCDSYSDGTFDSGIAASIARNGTLAFVATDARHARELYVVRSLHDPRPPRRLTHFNDWLEGVQLGRTTQFRWSGPHREPETGVLIYPPGMRLRQRYPIVVFIHGGPGEASIDSFVWESWPMAQLIAARGFLVFQPNYRGSDDHGNAFMLGIYRDTVAGPAADILSGLAAVKALPQADPARVAVCGWSYGGLLTSWLIAQRHDWRAAVSGAAVNDEREEYDLSTSNVQDRYYLGTSPYAPGGALIYEQQSPLTYAAAVTTPTLIWSTTGDPVVPTTMSYSFFHALHERGVPSAFVEYVAASHGPDTPVMVEELSTRWLAWLNHYLR